jgi:hypothetical protein
MQSMEKKIAHELQYQRACWPFCKRKKPNIQMITESFDETIQEEQLRDQALAIFIKYDPAHQSQATLFDIESELSKSICQKDPQYAQLCQQLRMLALKNITTANSNEELP